jgi:hypothetical protein
VKCGPDASASLTVCTLTLIWIMDTVSVLMSQRTEFMSDVTTSDLILWREIICAACINVTEIKILENSYINLGWKWEKLGATIIWFYYEIRRGPNNNFGENTKDLNDGETEVF